MTPIFGKRLISRRCAQAILSGMEPSFQISGDSFQRSGQRFTEYANAPYWAEVARMSKGCSDRSPAALQVDPSALVWLATVAPDELESWQNQARTRFGAQGGQLPSTNELLQQLQLSLQLQKSAAAVKSAPVSLPAVKP